MDSTGGITGAAASVVMTSPSLGASVVSSAGLATSGFFSFLEKTLPKKLLRLETTGFSLGLSAVAASVSAAGSAAASASTAGVSSTVAASVSAIRLGGLGGGGLLSLGLFLLLLLAEAEERGTLAAGRAALGLLGLGLLLGLVLGSLAFLGRILSLGRLLGLGNVISRLVLLGNDRSRLEALDGALVDLGLGDGGGELLGLGDLEPQLGNPAVTLGGGGSLEAVLVALGGEVELVGAVDFGLAGISLWKSGLECRQLSHVLWNWLLTRLMMLVGAFLSPTKRRPLPVWEAQAMLL